LRSIVLMVSCTLFIALGQLLWKLSAPLFHLSFSGIVLNYFLILGFVSYGIGWIFLLVALKTTELTVAYPFVSMSFIWVGIASMVFLGELLSWLNWVGILAIVGGVIFITGGAR